MITSADEPGIRPSDDQNGGAPCHITLCSATSCDSHRGKMPPPKTSDFSDFSVVFWGDKKRRASHPSNPFTPPANSAWFRHGSESLEAADRFQAGAGAVIRAFPFADFWQGGVHAAVGRDSPDPFAVSAIHQMSLRFSSRAIGPRALNKSRAKRRQRLDLAA